MTVVIPSTEYDPSHFDPAPAAKRKAESLQGLLRSLPKVDRNGHSDCPFADQLYAEKDAEAERLELQLPLLDEELALLARRIEEAVRNLQVIASNAGRLQSVSDKGGVRYSGLRRPAGAGGVAREERDLLETIANIKRLLSEARAKAWPGGDAPQKRIALPVQPSPRVRRDPPKTEPKQRPAPKETGRIDEIIGGLQKPAGPGWVPGTTVRNHGSSE